MKISIAVPSYNYGKYIGKCLQSIKDQVYTKYEVLLADGGSTDESLEIINKFCENDSRFTLVSTADNGQSDAEVNYQDGEPHGLTRLYYQNGQLEQEGQFTDGKRNGWAKVYYENGQLLQEANYTDGKESGLWKQYYPNGQLEMQYNLQDGKFYGISKVYYENSQLKYERNYKDGILILEKCWDERGNVKECKTID